LEKITTLEELLPLREHWRAQGYTVVFTNGHFELLHVGHVEYLEQARRLGDVLIVGLNGDASTRLLKGPGRPLVPAADRARVLAALACVDYVIIFDQPTAEELVAALRPEVYVKGGDYAAQEGTPGKKFPPEARVVARYGGRVEIIPYREGYSTSELMARIRELKKVG